MDSSEYQLLKIEYSEEDKKNIDAYNDSHISKALDLLKYNRNKILDDKDYEKLDIVDRMKFIQSHDDFKDFCKQYPVVSKYIVCFGLFSKNAFNKYINWISILRPSDEYRKVIINNQREQQKFKNKYIYAIYVKFLYQEKMKSANLSEINKAYDLTVADLNKETDSFFELYEREVIKQNKKKELSAEEKKQKIINQLKIKLES